MKRIQNKSLLLAGALIAGLMSVSTTFAEATITVPTPGVNVLNNHNNNWHCTATDYDGKRWRSDGHDYNDARNNALNRCQDHSGRRSSCRVERGDCSH